MSRKAPLLVPQDFAGVIHAKHKHGVSKKALAEQSLQRSYSDIDEDNRKLRLEVMELATQRDRAIEERDAHRDLSTVAHVFIETFQSERRVEFARGWVADWVSKMREALRRIPDAEEDLPTEAEVARRGGL